MPSPDSEVEDRNGRNALCLPRVDRERITFSLEREESMGCSGRQQRRCRFPLKRGLALQHEQAVSVCVCTLKYGTGPLKRVLTAEARFFLGDPEETVKQVLPRA